MTHTPEQLRQIDVLLARHVMGGTFCDGQDCNGCDAEFTLAGDEVRRFNGAHSLPWSPATDWNAMGEVIERFEVGMVEIDNGWRELEGERINGWTVRITCPGQEGEATAPTLPLAASLAALKAVGKEWTP